MEGRDFYYPIAHMKFLGQESGSNKYRIPSRWSKKSMGTNSGKLRKAEVVSNQKEL